MQLFTIHTTKKNRVFSIDTGGFFGLGIYFHQQRSKIDGGKEHRRVIQRSYALMMPFFAFEIEVFIR
tara:strand:- start:749 stop:949 length:201 start_codon:yes stop_codon:yes gene_type:complete